MRVGQQVERQEEEAPAGVELARGIGKLRLDLAPLALDRRQLGLELVAWPVQLADELEVPVFLLVELLQAKAEPLLDAAQARQLGLEGVVQLRPDARLKLGVQADGGVVLLHRSFHPGDGQVGQRASSLLAAPAQEVEVDPAVALARAQDQPLAAAGAPQQALEVVVVDALARAAATVQGKYPLDALEGVRRHQGFVAAAVLLAPVDHDAEVVAVAQHGVEPGLRQRRRRQALVATGPQSCLGHDLLELRAGVPAGSEQFESLADERAPHGINSHGADLAALVLLADVEVAKLGHADGAAVLGLLAHLVGDVGAAGLGLVLVHRVHDGLDHARLG